MKRAPSSVDVAIGLKLLTPSERRRAVLLLISTFINGLLQTVALAGVLPFIQSLMAPEAAVNAKWMVWLRALGMNVPADRLLSTVGLCLLALILVKNIYAWLQIRWQSRFCANCEQRLAADLLLNLLGASYAWNIQQNSSVLRDIIISHVVQWSRGFLRTSLQLANDFLFAVSAVAFLIYASPSTGTMIFCAMGGIAILLQRSLRPHLLAKSLSKREANYRAGILCNEALAGVKDVKMTGSQALFVKGFKSVFSTYSFADSDIQQLSILPRLSLEVLGYGALIGTAIVLTFRGGDYSQAASVLALYGIAAIRLLPVFSSAISSANKLLDALPLIQDIYRIHTETAVGEGTEATSADPFVNWKEIILSGVGYRYAPNNTSALHEITATINRGESIGIVGPSGAGKSTLADLLCALLEPSEGTLTVGEHAVHGPDRFTWRNHIGYVSQSPFLLDATLRENIVFNQPQFDEGRLASAVKAAHLEQVITHLPDGLDTRLGERGVRLSGGQRQRVAIARALYRNADLLILDEATSALDTLSEQEVTEAIRQLAGTITVVVIAHRLATVKHCNRILVVKNGTLIGIGSHETLLNTCPTYLDMVRQSNLSENSTSHPTDNIGLP
ncbi:MAG: ABC transporter ATP-binding protein [Rhodospirillaceae bacterium]|nr:ABC transporter ATP-binding protein [Rhodospirillaceae bacterium]